MYGNIYVRGGHGDSLDSFANWFCRRFGLPAPEFRLSSNYLGEKYARSTVFAIDVKIALADSAAIPKDFQFWVGFKVPMKYKIEEEVFLESLSDLVARVLTLEGMAVLRAPDDHLVSGRPLSYSLRGDLIEVKSE